MTKTAVVPVGQKPALAKRGSWSAYDPHLPPRRASVDSRTAPTVTVFDRSNSPHFPSVTSASRG